MKRVKTIKTRGMIQEPAYIEVLDSEPKVGRKQEARYRIHNEVFDLEDSVADNAKMISLLTTMISRIWDIQTDSQKNSLPDADREAIDYVVSSFKDTITWADIKWASEGIGFADKLIKRQARIGSIIKKVYG